VTDQEDRLRARVARERLARSQAEAIAEQGLRELFELNQDLDRKVNDRVAEVKRLAARAERAERVRDELLSNLSHEIRTPLTAIFGALEIMRDGEENPEELLDIAQNGALRLQRLFDDLFDVVELGTGSRSDERRDTEVSEIVGAITSRWQTKALQAGTFLTVSSSVPPRSTILVDPEIVIKIVDRVVENAICHGGPGTTSVTVEPSSHELRIAVKDEGPGFDDTFQDRLFKPFELGDATSTRDHQGAGLGLPLAAGFAELLGGSLSISSNPNHGTTALVRLPAEWRKRTTASNSVPSV